MKYSNIKPLNFINGEFSKQVHWTTTKLTDYHESDLELELLVMELADEVDYKIIMN